MYLSFRCLPQIYYKYILQIYNKGPCFRRTPPSDDFLTILQQTVSPSTIARQQNVDTQRVMQITRPPKPKPKPKPKPGKLVAKPTAPPPPSRQGAPIAKLAPRNPKRAAKLDPRRPMQNRVHYLNGGEQPSADNASDDEDDGPEVALFAANSDSDNSSLPDDDDIVAILDEEEVFGHNTSTWYCLTCCPYNVPETVL